MHRGISKMHRHSPSNAITDYDDMRIKWKMRNPDKKLSVLNNL